MIQCECSCVCCDTQVFLLPDGQAPREMHCPSCGRRLPVRHIQPFGEAEWLACTDLFTLLQYRRRPFTDRKLRLFACACCRQLWDLLNFNLSRAAVEVAERFADGLATEAELSEAHERAAAVIPSVADPAQQSAARAAAEAAGRRASLTPVVRPFGVHWARRRSEDSAQLAALLREVLGNPFRPLNGEGRHAG
jgi:hypothetical protein